MQRVCVIGAGSWGTALAWRLAHNGAAVSLCDPRPGVFPKIGAGLPPTLSYTDPPSRSLSAADMTVVAVPSPHLRAVALSLLAPHLPPAALVVVASKGLEEGTLLTPHEVLSGTLPRGARIVGLGGPSFAAEVAQGLPTCVVLASSAPGAAAAAAAAFHGDRFRCFLSQDVAGVELGAALKNVYAIAVGVSDGAGLGANARAALLTRGLNEMTRITVAKGGSPLTMLGLAGLGDLVLTCTGDLSRNRRVGLALGRGASLDAALAALGGQVAEGVHTTRTARALAARLHIRAPILENVHALLFEGKAVRDAVRELTSTELKGEWE
jgi:glycerol-3-phosphate dehydrogenase (NAD(P)+)